MNLTLFYRYKASDEMVQILTAQKEHLLELDQLIRGLAEFEQLLPEMVSTIENLEGALFSNHPTAQCIIAFNDQNLAIGFALYSFTYSTFKGKSVLWLEDVFVSPKERGNGVGKALWVELNQISLKNQCCRIEFRVLHWNQPAINFYQKQGAQVLGDWATYRLNTKECET